MRPFIFLLLSALALPLPALANDLGNSSWSETDDNNNAASPNGWTGGSMLPNQVEPTARAMMGALKRAYDHAGPTVTSGGTANAQTLTYSVAPAALVTGDTFAFKVGSSLTNTGAATLNVNALGAKTIQANGKALTGGELTAGRVAVVEYDGTNFQLLANGPRMNVREVEQFGAVGDGSTDDSGAFQAAINWAQTAGGGHIRLRDGATYAISTALTLDGSGITIEGSRVSVYPKAVVGDTPTAPAIIKWTGSNASAPFYMLTISPSSGDHGGLVSDAVRGVMFNCNGVTGCSGALIKSVMYSDFTFGVWEPRPVNYTANGASASGQQTLNLTSTTGIAVGMQVESANIPTGVYVESVSAGSVTLSGQIATSFTGNESIGFGGEGVRFDVQQSLTDANNNQYITGALDVRNESGTGNEGPGIVFGGSNIANEGYGASHTNYGNTNYLSLSHASCSFTFNGNACVVFSNSDHNLIDYLSGTVVVPGAVSGDINGGGRFFKIRYWAGSAFTVQGSDTGGYVADSAGQGHGIYVDLNQASSATPTCGTGVHAVWYRAQGDRIWSMCGDNGSASGLKGVFPFVSVTPSNPIGTTSTSFVMMGLGSSLTLTPSVTGRLDISVNGSIKNDTTGDGAAVELRCGTGTAPANGAAATGTNLTANESLVNTPSGTFAAPFSVRAMHSFPSTIDVATWCDLAVAASIGGTASVLDLTGSIKEF